MSQAGDAATRPGSVLSRWRTVIVFGLLGLVLGFGWGIADQPVYRASAGVAVESDSQGSDEARLERFAQRGESGEVATEAAGLLGGDVAGADLLSEVSVRPAPRGGALIVSVTSDTPDFAAATADGFAEALVKVEGDPLTLGAAAAIPTSPIENRSAPLSAAVGLLIGLALGLTVAMAMALAARRADPGGGRGSDQGDEVEDEHQPEAAPDPIAVLAGGLNAPVLGTVVGSRLAFADGAPGVIGTETAEQDEVRAIAAALGLDEDRAPGSIAVTEIGAGSIGSTFCAGLAVAAAESGVRVLLVEADLGEPDLARGLRVAPAPGLHEYLDGGASPREVLRTVRAGSDDADEPVSFVCVPAGRTGADASLDGPRFAGLVGRLSRAYELVIYASPILGSEDADALADLVDGVVVLADRDAPADDLTRAVELLSTARILGIVGARN